ncbi:MAG TPA: beta-ketoacyl synthase N-terminal-like domain-containing protein, partial [Kofleriaceae bacterium]|nr:beta-ketoacyl synthase N-terminal-like domain-containing protein [Kofleriaceae bacterium]
IADPGALPARQGFLDLGLDSMMAVELRQRLIRRTGLAIPATLVFDQPTVEASAAWIVARLAATAADVGAPVAPAALAPPSPRASDEPIAIVGAGLTLPGGAVDLETLWQLLRDGRDTVRAVPLERCDLDALYDPDPAATGTSSVRHAALLDEVPGFDAALFGISPREAEPMDPQHRLLLEAAWVALEHAGFAPTELRDTDTAVFVGIGPSEYANHRGRRAGELDAYDVTGRHSSFAAGRIAYHLGLQGPAASLDTACSSSLVALHLACDALRSGASRIALAGGANFLADPTAFVGLSRLRAVSPDGRCKTFSAAADGYGRGEGVGVLTLMRLSDAQADGRRILGIVRGSAVNHDGASSGITAPNGTSQQRVLRAALARAALAAADIDFVECHGTGTALGDPIEVQALAAVYGQGRAPDRPLLIGTIKTNIGHLEPAAGVAGVLKVLASFEHDALPASLRTTPRNPHIDWDALPVRVVDELVPWQRNGRPRRAGVSSFGVSGTNAHVILEEAPAAPEAPRDSASAVGGSAAVAAPAARAVPLVICGHSEAALRGNAARLAEQLVARPETPVVDVAYSLVTTRSALAERAVVRAADTTSAAQALAALASGELPTGALRATAGGSRAVWLFPGQGSQYPGMCRGLLGEPIFAGALAACDEALQRHGCGSVVAVLRADDASQQAALADVAVVQPVLFAVA